jgi:hypothetical protein
MLGAAALGLPAGRILAALAPKEVEAGARWLSLLKRGLLLAFAIVAGLALGLVGALAVPVVALLIVTFGGRWLVWLSYATLIPVAVVLSGSPIAAGLAFLFGLPSGSLATTGSALRMAVVCILVGLLAAAIL